jgi:ABC-type antimicrobial peptide transport system ATPase subunit
MLYFLALVHTQTIDAEMNPYAWWWWRRIVCHYKRTAMKLVHKLGGTAYTDVGRGSVLGYRDGDSYPDEAFLAVVQGVHGGERERFTR